MIDFVPLGDRAFLARFATEDTAARWAEAVRELRWPGVVDVVTAYHSVGVHADADRADLNELAKKLNKVRPFPASAESGGRLVELPVCYDGVDLPEVASRLGKTESQVIAEHSGTAYHVFAIGFLPGFPYAGYLPAALSGLPRRASPRARVPAGSVAMVGRQTGVYPGESPGGWHLIGTTPLSIVDLETARFPIRAGDRLRFVPIDRDEFGWRQGEPLQ
jgi:KipI family sensor histidine kinase inhibitor